MAEDSDEECVAIKLQDEEFTGLISNIGGSSLVSNVASGIIRDRIGGTAGDLFQGLMGQFGAESQGQGNGSYGGGGYNERGGYGYNRGSAYGGEGYNQRGGYGGYDSRGYDNEERYKREEYNNDTGSGIGLVGNLIGGILSGGKTSNIGSGGYNDNYSNQPNKFGKHAARIMMSTPPGKGSGIIVYDSEFIIISTFVDSPSCPIMTSVIIAIFLCI
ncbi:unnamed protein product [Thelazia callipaeda]|uniref:Glycine-rich cell wall structural protein 1.0-like n=1 Tax=Thelazia callipaeda TaxID=103827 RepID=A0A0N5D1C1_THECL|nr:unnamed protein product [Thelazia callipaeda]